MQSFRWDWGSLDILGRWGGRWCIPEVLLFCHLGGRVPACFVPSTPFHTVVLLTTLLFLALLQVAHPLVQKQLVDYIHNGFLVPVMGPALHKVRVVGGKVG